MMGIIHNKQADSLVYSIWTPSTSLALQHLAELTAWRKAGVVSVLLGWFIMQVGGWQLHVHGRRRMMVSPAQTNRRLAGTKMINSRTTKLRGNKTVDFRRVQTVVMDG